MLKKKIRILYIIPSLASGGAERFIIDLMNHLNKDDFEVSLLCFNGAGFFEEELKELGINYHILNKKYKIDIVNFCNIYKYIKKYKADIVHTQLGGDIYGKLAAKLAGVKRIVSTEQNVLINDNFVVKLIKSFTSSFSDKIVAISNSVLNDMLKEYGLNRGKLVLIPNGINLAKFEKRKVPRSDFFCIGSVGRLVEQKNYSLLIKALAVFKDYNFKCLIAGEGPEKESLESLIKKHNLQDKVELLGNVKDVPSFLSQLDLFVLPSKWEGLGVVLLEAALSSVSVLASNTGGIPDVIIDKKTGLLFENNNKDDLVSKLSFCLDETNADYLNKLSNSLYNKVREEFDIRYIANKYSSLYFNLF